MDEQLIELIRSEHTKTGRDFKEIIDTMRDEGYIAGTNADMAELLALCAPGHTDLMISPEAIDKAI